VSFLWGIIGGLKKTYNQGLKHFDFLFGYFFF